MLRPVRVTGLLLIAIAACGDDGTGPSGSGDPVLITPVPAGLTGSIAVVTARDGGARVHIIDLTTGSRRVVYSSSEAGVAGLTWSPDGSHLVLNRYRPPELFGERDGVSELRRVNADGSGDQLTFAGPGPESSPAYSRGGRFAFFRADIGGDQGTWYDIHATAPPVVHRTGGGGIYNDLTWGPGGDVLYYAQFGPVALRQVTLSTGSDALVLGPTGLEGIRSPAASPDGTQLAYVRTEPNGLEEIWVVDADGSSQRRVTVGTSPRWTPGGESIAFVDGVGDSGGIYLIAPEGGTATRLVRGSDVTLFAFSWPEGQGVTGR